MNKYVMDPNGSFQGSPWWEFKIMIYDLELDSDGAFLVPTVVCCWFNLFTP